MNITAPNRHVITEAEQDENPWATCGPNALAALCGRSLADVRPAFAKNTETSDWTNLPRMLHALHRLGLRWRMMPAGGGDGAGGGAPEACTERIWPQRGLVQIQFRGPWDTMPVNHAAQTTRSHWIAVRPWPLRSGLDVVFDGNAVGIEQLRELDYWQPRQVWERAMVPLLVEHLGRKATGKWWVRAALEVLP